MRRTLVVVIALLAGVVACASLGACQFDPGSKESWQAQVDNLESANSALAVEVERLRRVIAENEALLAEIPDDDSRADKVRDALEDAGEALDKAIARRGDIEAAIASLRANIDAIGEADGAAATALQGVGAVGTSVAPLLPPPWNALVLVGTGLFGVLAGVLKKRPGDATPAEVTKATDKAWDEAYREGQRTGYEMGKLVANAEAKAAG